MWLTRSRRHERDRHAAELSEQRERVDAAEAALQDKGSESLPHLGIPASLAARLDALVSGRSGEDFVAAEFERMLRGGRA